jgi:L-fuconolactonase
MEKESQMSYSIVDTHVHFWDMDRFDYFWLKPEYGILYQTYLPEQIRGEMEATGVERGVFVQANHLLEENDWVLNLAETHTWITGMVGWVDLTDSNVGGLLDGYNRNSRFKGVRHLIHEEPDDRWLLRPDVQPGLEALAERGLTFDIVALPRHLPYLPEVVSLHPNLNFVIDHMAKPPIASGDLDSWARDLEGVAAFSNVHCKVSGLITEATPGAWTPDELKPAIQIGIDLFGFDRLMFGGDWPVSLLACSYPEVVDATRAALAGVSEGDLRKFWSGNATRFYRLDD